MLTVSGIDLLIRHHHIQNSTTTSGFMSWFWRLGSKWKKSVPKYISEHRKVKSSQLCRYLYLPDFYSVVRTDFFHLEPNLQNHDMKMRCTPSGFFDFQSNRPPSQIGSSQIGLNSNRPQVKSASKWKSHRPKKINDQISLLSVHHKSN
jgi:hypothetical protein